MRIDKFLKVSRLIKRRTVAKEMADQERVLVNGRQVKSSYNVAISDIIEIQFGVKALKVKVLNIKETTKKAEASDLYEVVE